MTGGHRKYDLDGEFSLVFFFEFVRCSVAEGLV
ncbi:MAG: hypothetical protein ACI93T_004553, partial [Porticoccaceae bacterium]